MLKCISSSHLSHSQLSCKSSCHLLTLFRSMEFFISQDGSFYIKRGAQAKHLICKKSKKKQTNKHCTYFSDETGNMVHVKWRIIRYFNKGPRFCFFSHQSFHRGAPNASRSGSVLVFFRKIYNPAPLCPPPPLDSHEEVVFGMLHSH